jgi:GntR family transcriptional regulator/MocR family aminotransferase
LRSTTLGAPVRTTSKTDLLVSVDRASDVSLRLQVERQLRQAVQSGRLRSGAALPSTRTLAADLGLSRGLIVEAYEQLTAEGYLTSAHGSGTRVGVRRKEVVTASSGQPIAFSPRYDFRPGLPDLSLFPGQAWLASMRRALSASSSDAFDYPDTRGAPGLRAALASYLDRARATVAHADRIVVCSGASQGIDLICRVLSDRGARSVAVEDPGPSIQYTRIQAAGLIARPVPVDDDGIVVDRLDRTDASAVLVTPAHQFPSGVVLAPRRRAALLDWAARRNALIIEDDYDAEYRYDREPIGAMQGLAPDRVVYVGTTSKTLAPALRLGWLLAPEDMAVALTHAKLIADRGSPALEQAAFAEFLERGEMDRHVRRMRVIYRRRRDALVGALRQHLPNLRILGVAAGLHVVVELHRDIDEAALVGAAKQRSIRVDAASAYFSKPRTRPPGLVLGYGALSEDSIPDAAKALADVVGQFIAGRGSRRPR